jgi:hypothetical protein
MKMSSANQLVFGYKKTKLYLSCLVGLFLTAFSLYVITKETTPRATLILASLTAIISFLLTLRCLARTQEKIILMDNSIQWVRLWRTVSFPLAKISGLDPYKSVDETGLEVSAQTGQKIRFTTDIAGFWTLSRELKNHLFVRRRNA